MKKKIFAFLTALCMTAAMLPAVFADGEEEPIKCTCTTQCTEESKNEACPVCGGEDADLNQCIGLPPMTVGTQEQCSCVVLCTEGNTNPDCPVCSAEGVTACKGEPVVPVLYGAPKAGGVPYLDESGQEQNCSDATPVTASDTIWTDTTTSGWYVAQSDITIGSEDKPQRVTVEGNVNLILADGCNLTVNGGIEVEDPNSLTIYAQSTGSSMGTLNATGAKMCAGIGGGNRGDGGNITINGGKITATGGGPSHGETAELGGAGIGGGAGSGNGGNITINGGTVTAIGSNAGYDDYGAGAGIGGGGVGIYGTGGDGGNITINGGTITATGGAGAAGIGGGNSKSNNSTIIISGGVVTATGGNEGAGIGGGNRGGGEITISGGTVTANGGAKGAGIGGGNWGIGNVTISGGVVTATGGSSAPGIGGGYQGSGGSFSTGIDGNAVIFATGGSGGSGIQDNDDTSGWSGVIFQGNEGTVYGDVTLEQDLEIESDKTLTIPAGSSLTVPNGRTLTNKGTIKNEGTIQTNGAVQNDGTMTNDGTIQNNGTMTNGGTIQNNDTIGGSGSLHNNGTLEGNTPSCKVENPTQPQPPQPTDPTTPETTAPTDTDHTVQTDNSGHAPVEDNTHLPSFWELVTERINATPRGGEITINMGARAVPDSVLNALRARKLTATFRYGDTELTLTPDQLPPEGMLTEWTLHELGNYLTEADESIRISVEKSEAENQATAAETTTPAADTGKPNPATGETTSTAAALLVAVVALTGLCVTLKKK